MRRKPTSGAAPRYESVQPVCANALDDPGTRSVRPADRARHDRRVDLVPAHGRSRSWHRRGATPQRHVQQLRPSGGAAVPFCGRAHEHQQHDRQAAALLGHINIVQSIIFAGMSGSAIADVAGTGRISIDMMTRNQKYPVSYAAAITAASAVIGPIIPPSIPMVLYALISDASIGYLFLGGVIPGLLMALAQMVINTVMAHRRNFPVEKPIPLREWPGLTVAALPALLMPVILLGGIYGGVMTPTEAAAVAAAYAFL